MEGTLHQTIYMHGGSRIWIQNTDGSRELIADTYKDVQYAIAVRDFTDEWLKNKQAD
jgi:hypothetical protein